LPDAFDLRRTTATERTFASKEISMRTFNLLTVIGLSAFLLLSACHTTAGAGKDLSSAGKAITHSADEHSY